MALVRWEPAREINSLQQEMNRLFSTFFDTPTSGNGSAARRWIPAMDLVETEDHYVLTADLPGLSQLFDEDEIFSFFGQECAYDSFAACYLRPQHLKKLLHLEADQKASSVLLQHVLAARKRALAQYVNNEVISLAVLRKVILGVVYDLVRS